MEQNFVVSKFDPFLSKGVRLAESPTTELKTYQKRIYNKLCKLEIPNNIFCGMKGKSYMDNARQHINNKNMFKIDISKFYPSITRDKVYCFFVKNMKMSPDVSEIMTNFATIDLDLKKQTTKNMIRVNEFMSQKQIHVRNHLATGTPFGSLLSYLVNIDMYSELQNYADKNGLTMTAYIDDIAFSTNNNISGKIRRDIINIIRKHKYCANMKKCKYYGEDIPKRLTGGIITTSKKIDAQNKLIQKANKISEKLKNKTLTLKDINHSYGIIASIEMSDRKMPQLKKQLKIYRKQGTKN